MRCPANQNRFLMHRLRPCPHRSPSRGDRQSEKFLFRHQASLPLLEPQTAASAEIETAIRQVVDQALVPILSSHFDEGIKSPDLSIISDEWKKSKA